MGRAKLPVPERFCNCNKCGSKEIFWKKFKSKQLICQSCGKTFYVRLENDEEQLIQTKQKKSNKNKFIENEIQIDLYNKNVANSGNSFFSMLPIEIFKDDLKKIKDKEEKTIIEALLRCGMSCQNAAMMLGTTYNKVHYTMNKYLDIKMKAQQILLENTENIAFYLANKRLNSRMIEFLLKSLNPNFKEKVENTIKTEEMPTIIIQAFDVEEDTDGKEDKII